MPSIAAALGCEHIGHEAECDGRGGYRLTGRAEARAVFCADNEILAGLVAEGLKCHGIDRTLVLPPYLFGTEPPCDAAPFFTAGVPSASMISSPMYAFDDQDTLDKVREEDLAPVAEFFAELICRLDRVGAADLQAGVSRERGAEPPPLPSWFMEPGRIIAGLRKASEP